MRAILECGQPTSVLLLSRSLNVDKNLVSYIVSDLKRARLVEGAAIFTAVPLQRLNQTVQRFACADLDRSVSAYLAATSAAKRARVPSVAS